MKIKLISISFVATLISISLATPLKPVKAQSEICPPTGITPASRSTRTYINRQFNFAFNLPENYRLMANNASDYFFVSVIDPQEFERARCREQNRNRIQDDNFPFSIKISLKSVNNRNSNLMSLAAEGIGGRFLFDNGNYQIIRTLTVAGRDAILYRGGLVSDEAFVSFLSPNKKHFITVTSPYFYDGQNQPPEIFNKNVFDLVLDSFTFNPN